jgi:MFS family permease
LSALDDSGHLRDAGETIEPIELDERAAHQVEAARRRSTAYWVGVILVLVLLTEQSALAINLMAPTLPKVAELFQTTQVIWVITAFTLVGGVATPLLSKLADLYGKKKVLVVTALVAAVGALISSVASSYGMLLFGRCLSGVSIAFIPLAYSLMRDIFPPKLLALAIAITTNGIGLVTIGGPFLAGYLADNHGVRSVFWFVFAAAALGGILTLLIVPETPVRVKARIDWLGAVLLAGGLAAVLLGLTQAQTWQWGDARTLACLIGGTALLIIWGIWETRTRDPLVSMQLLSRRPVFTTMVAAGLAVGAISGAATLLPTMLQMPTELAPGYGFGASVTETAYYTLAAGILTVAGGFFVGWTAKSIGFRNHLAIGAAFIALGSLLLGVAHAESWQIVVFYGFIGAGAIVYAAVPNLVVGAVPVDQQAISAGMVGTAQTLVAAVVTQLVFVVLTNNVATVVEGFPIYSEAGFRNAFLLSAAVGLVGALVALAIPHGRRVTRTAADKGAPLARAAAR